MLDPALRPVKDRLLRPAARAMSRRVHPNLVTVVGFGVGLACVGAVARGAFGVAMAMWALNRVLDGLDGVIARQHRQQSDLGGYLDLLLDFVVYALVPVALVLTTSQRDPTGSAARWLWLALLLASFYVNAASWMYLAALLEKRAAGAAARGETTSVTMPTGLVEGTETMVLYALFMLFPAALTWLFGAMALLVCVTIVQRLVWAVRILT